MSSPAPAQLAPVAAPVPTPSVVSRSSRVPQFDSVRGLAAAIVVLNHYLLVPDEKMAGWPHSLARLFYVLQHVPPLAWLSNGRSAVMLFFVLSGFSLHRMLSRPMPFSRYAARRTCRIYLPYLGALALAISANAVFSRGPIAGGTSTWFNKTWPWPVSMTDVIHHVFFLSNYHYAVFNGAFWSLRQEMRISLIFPVLMLIARIQQPFTQWLSITITLAVGAAIAAYSDALAGDIAATILFAGVFLLGVMLSINADRWASLLARQSLALRLAFACSALLLLFDSQTVVHRLFHSDSAFWSDPGMGLGSAGILLSILSSSSVSAILLRQPFKFLGQISYSLYLVHVPVLFAVVRVLHMRGRGIGEAFVPFVLLTIVVATIFYQLVEKNAIALSHRFGRNRATDRPVQIGG